MKERPILMTPENAQKVFDGTKPQTRRIVKRTDSGRVKRVGSTKNWHLGDPDAVLACPYGLVGDRLWIREAHQFDPPDDGTWAYAQFMGCKGSLISDIPERFRKPGHCLYRGNWDGSPLIWRPSLHMPRWACRTVVELTEVRVERLREITEEGAKAEGIDVNTQHVAAFVVLWESINGKGSWALNPWVWVLTFRKVA